MSVVNLAVQVSGFQILFIVILIVIIAYLLYLLYMWWMRRDSAKLLSQDDFRQQMRQAQVIDAREAQEYESAHILGARNIPYSQAKENLPGLNKNQAIFLYDDGMNVATRMARLLKKAGYQDIYILEDGFSEWQGKIKRPK
ncbi:MAG: rhodanese-like domain-containing protein [Aerococcus sp.]|nr:rhodanese-like domain-containing protein [Aerococcus sp.]